MGCVHVYRKMVSQGPAQEDKLGHGAHREFEARSWDCRIGTWEGKEILSLVPQILALDGETHGTQAFSCTPDVGPEQDRARRACGPQ